jgi:hypothetical protein
MGDVSIYYDNFIYLLPVPVASLETFTVLIVKYCLRRQDGGCWKGWHLLYLDVGGVRPNSARCQVSATNSYRFYARYLGTYHSTFYCGAAMCFTRLPVPR